MGCLAVLQAAGTLSGGQQQMLAIGRALMARPSDVHQAFREHGMTLPRKLSKWGRTYVASWIEKDRVANIPIDPRALAYAAGRRSPYEPLRMVPPTWRIFRSAADPTPPTIARLLRLHSLGTVVSRALHRLGQHVPKDLAYEALSLLRLAVSFTIHGTIGCLFGFMIMHDFHLLPQVFPKQPGDLTWAESLAAIAGGLWLANLAVLWRTMRR